MKRIFIILLLAATPLQAAAWETKPYSIANNINALPFSPGSAPPAGWKPDLTEGLDAALPFPWPRNYVETFKQYFNPFTFAKNAVVLCTHLRETGDAETRRIIEALHARLLEYSTVRDGQRFLLYRFKKGYRGKFQVKVPWTSAYASGAALAGLTFMSKCADMPTALQTAREVLAGLGNPIDPREAPRPEHWVSFVDERGFLWFEEKPLNQVEQPRILNGHIRALTGLYTYWAHTKDDAALQLLRAGIRTVEEYAPSYRNPGGVNAYDLMQPYFADYGPARTIAQQDILFRMTGAPVFAAYRDMFEADMRDEIQKAKEADE